MAELRERLAELEHEQWCDWVGCIVNNLDVENLRDWLREIQIPYQDLTEAEKGPSRKYADKALEIIGDVPNGRHDYHTKRPKAGTRGVVRLIGGEVIPAYYKVCAENFGGWYRQEDHSRIKGVNEWMESSEGGCPVGWIDAVEQLPHHTGPVWAKSEGGLVVLARHMPVSYARSSYGRAWVFARDQALLPWAVKGWCESEIPCP